jgi:hypothetical protein
MYLVHYLASALGESRSNRSKSTARHDVCCVAAIFQFAIKDMQYANTPTLHRVMKILGVMRRTMEQLLRAAVLRKSAAELAQLSASQRIEMDAAVCASAEVELLTDALSRISFGNSSAFVIHPLHVVAAMLRPLSVRLLFVTDQTDRLLGDSTMRELARQTVEGQREAAAAAEAAEAAKARRSRADACTPSVLSSIDSYAAVLLAGHDSNAAADDDNDEAARYLAQKHILTHLCCDLALLFGLQLCGDATGG